MSLLGMALVEAMHLLSPAKPRFVAIYEKDEVFECEGCQDITPNEDASQEPSLCFACFDQKEFHAMGEL